MAVNALTARRQKWQGWMIVIMFAVLLATTGLASNFNRNGDYNGDGIMDPTVYDNPTGEWHILLSNGEGGFKLESFFWGGPDCTPIQSDYDGDGRADIVLYNHAIGLWILLLSGNNYQTPPVTFDFGGTDWVVVTGDYDNDGKTDPAIYCESTGAWAIRFSSLDYAIVSFTFGGPGYAAVSGDYDGDGCSDPTVYQRSSGQWFIRCSAVGYTLHTCYVNTKGDGPLVPAPADYDGDRKTDPAVYAYCAPSFKGKQYVFAFHLLSSAQNFKQIESFYQLGREDCEPSNADPAPGDYYGGGQASFAVAWPDFESANVMWRMWQSAESGHYTVVQWSGTDVHPVQR